MPSVSVLEAHQKPTDKPTRRIKRSGGQSLHAQGKADWIIKNVLLQMLPESAWIAPRYVHSPSDRTVSYVPVAEQSIDPRLAKLLSNGLPPAELPGIIVVGLARNVRNPEQICF